MAAFGRVRLLTNSSSLKAEGLVALQEKDMTNHSREPYTLCVNVNKNVTVELLLVKTTLKNEINQKLS